MRNFHPLESVGRGPRMESVNSLTAIYWTRALLRFHSGRKLKKCILS